MNQKEDAEVGEVCGRGGSGAGLRGGGSSDLGQGGQESRGRVPGRSWWWNQLIVRWLWMEGMSEREGFRMTPATG